jgi:hypothetical protein
LLANLENSLINLSGIVQFVQVSGLQEESHFVLGAFFWRHPLHVRLCPIGWRYLFRIISDCKTCERWPESRMSDHVFEEPQAEFILRQCLEWFIAEYFRDFVDVATSLRFIQGAVGRAVSPQLQWQP